MTGRRLHGRRGLKSRRPAAHDFRGWSPPSRAAWIEMQPRGLWCWRRSSRRLHGRRGLKSCTGRIPHRRRRSPPSRAAWIEIRAAEDAVIKEDVAAFTGGVD